MAVSHILLIKAAAFFSTKCIFKGRLQLWIQPQMSLMPILRSCGVLLILLFNAWNFSVFTWIFFSSGWIKCPLNCCSGTQHLKCNLKPINKWKSLRVCRFVRQDESTHLLSHKGISRLCRPLHQERIQRNIHYKSLEDITLKQTHNIWSILSSDAPTLVRYSIWISQAWLIFVAVISIRFAQKENVATKNN